MELQAIGACSMQFGIQLDLDFQILMSVSWTCVRTTAEILTEVLSAAVARVSDWTTME